VSWLDCSYADLAEYSTKGVRHITDNNELWHKKGGKEGMETCGVGWPPGVSGEVSGLVAPAQAGRQSTFHEPGPGATNPTPLLKLLEGPSNTQVSIPSSPLFMHNSLLSVYAVPLLYYTQPDQRQLQSNQLTLYITMRRLIFAFTPITFHSPPFLHPSNAGEFSTHTDTKSIHHYIFGSCKSWLWT